MGAFKVDQISFVYFFPGLLVIFGAFGVMQDVPCIQKRFSKDFQLDGTLAFAMVVALSYSIGYACWVVSDQWKLPLAILCQRVIPSALLYCAVCVGWLQRGCWSLLAEIATYTQNRKILGQKIPPALLRLVNRVRWQQVCRWNPLTAILSLRRRFLRPGVTFEPVDWRLCGTIGYKAVLEVFRYVCHDKPLRQNYVEMLRQRGYEALAKRVETLFKSGVFYDRCEREWQQRCRTCCDLLYKCCRKKGCLKHRLTRSILFRDGRRLWLLIWDWAYNGGNQYHIGRFISSWNNLKFLKASAAACVVPLVFFVGRIVCRQGCGTTMTWITVILLSLLLYVFGGIGVRWRRRVWARDLVHALTPYHPMPTSSSSQGLPPILCRH